MIALVVVSVILGTDGPPEVALHFPTVVHALVWRNWPLVPTDTPLLFVRLTNTGSPPLNKNV